jgi:hypothetical protein
MTEKTEPTPKKTEPDDPPGAVSDQNNEEAESGHRDDGTHPEPRTSEQSDRGS